MSESRWKFTTKNISFAKNQINNQMKSNVSYLPDGTYITSNWGWATNKLLNIYMCYTPCLSSFMFSQEFYFWYRRCVQYALDIMYRYSFLWCIHVRLIFVIQIYVFKSKFLWLRETYTATWYEKPKVLEKNHNKLQLLDF